LKSFAKWYNGEHLHSAIRFVPRAHTTLAMTAQRWQTAPCSMQTRVRKTRNAGQAKPATGNPPDPFGLTPRPKSAPLKSETPHEIGGQLV